MGYTSITDIAAANSAIAELYGQTDALMRRAGSLAPIDGTMSFTGNVTLRKNAGQFIFDRAGSYQYSGIVFSDAAVSKNGIFYDYTNDRYLLGLNVDKVLLHHNNAFPVGSVVTIGGVGTNPATLLGYGTWASVSNTTDCKCMGSQRIHPGIAGSGNVAKTRLLAAYNYNLIEGPSPSIPVPAGYHTEVVLSAQAWSQQAATIYLYLGLGATHKTNPGGTYSDYWYRIGIRTPSIKTSDLVLDAVYGSSGVCLYYEVTGATANWELWDATVTWYCVSDETRYQWKRTA